MFSRFFGFVLLMLGIVPCVQGHEYKGMSTQVVIHDEGYAHVVLQVVATDAILLSPSVDRNKDARLSPEEFSLGKTLLALDLSRAFRITSDGTTATASKAEVEVSMTEGFTNEPHELRLTATFDAPGRNWGRVFIDPNLFRGIDTSPITGSAVLNSQKNTVSIVDRGRQVTLQSDGSDTYITQPGALASNGSTTGTGLGMGAVAGAELSDEERGATSTGHSGGMLLLIFLWQGVIHILLGWDHVLFVVGLLLLARNLKGLVQVITAFTVAHSITLIIVSLDIIEVGKANLVEAIVAASVAYVGLENLFRLDKGVQWRWVLVFAFGLIHGMGFAGLLKELLGGEMVGRSRAQLVGCLLTFNLGVELGQLFIIALLYPALGWLRKNKPSAARQTIIAASLVVFFFGFSFLLDRTFLPGRLPWVEWFG